MRSTEVLTLEFINAVRFEEGLLPLSSPFFLHSFPFPLLTDFYFLSSSPTLLSFIISFLSLFLISYFFLTLRFCSFLFLFSSSPLSLLTLLPCLLVSFSFNFSFLFIRSSYFLLSFLVLFEENKDFFVLIFKEMSSS